MGKRTTGWLVVWAGGATIMALGATSNLFRAGQDLERERDKGEVACDEFASADELLCVRGDGEVIARVTVVPRNLAKRTDRSPGCWSPKGEGRCPEGYRPVQVGVPSEDSITVDCDHPQVWCDDEGA